MGGSVDQENLASALAGEAASMVMAKNWLEDWRSWQDRRSSLFLLGGVVVYFKGPSGHLAQVGSKGSVFFVFEGLAGGQSEGMEG